MTRWLAVLAEFVLVPVIVGGAVWCWHNGLHPGWYRPAGETPGFDGVRYSGPWLSLAAVLVTIAGLVLIDVVARTVRFAR
ncbi:hypothetical protein [Nocardia jejuensis]|uniref:hypothetical protein n=1 Tax=Nocardia jejuensis TaxID=328049 RepID=UPI0008349E06|nr:hypothetical protein [Nocardia jejuensis]